MVGSVGSKGLREGLSHRNLVQNGLVKVIHGNSKTDLVSLFASQIVVVSDPSADPGHWRTSEPTNWSRLIPYIDPTLRVTSLQRRTTSREKPKFDSRSQTFAGRPRSLVTVEDRLTTLPLGVEGVHLGVPRSLGRKRREDREGERVFLNKRKSVIEIK